MNDLLLFGVAASYLTLGVFSPETAAGLWGAYALVTFVLAALNLGVFTFNKRNGNDGA